MYYSICAEAICVKAPYSTILTKQNGASRRSSN